MSKDMTEGRILPLIVKFTIPLICGNLLQLTYNAVDAMIVGKYVGDGALAAVGTSNPLMTLIVLFVQGICLGASVLIASLYGAKEYQKLGKLVSTAMIAGSVFSLFLTVLMLPAAPVMITLLRVDFSIRGIATGYLRIIAGGLIFTFIYNFFASTLRAMGDSRTPLLFLGISAIINILGDLFCVVILRGGVIGCAVSTVASEAISCLLCWLYIRRKIPVLNLGKNWLHFERPLLKQITQYGMVSALQQSTVQLGKVGMQAIVNTMGVSTSATFTAVNRIDDFALIPEQNISHAMMSVMAQNRGAGKMLRVNKAFRVGMILEMIYGTVVGILLLIFAEPVMHLFSKDAQTIATGIKYLRLIAFMYVIPAFTNGIQGFFRGMGDLKVTLWSSIINMGVRVASCIPMVFVWNMGFLALPWSYFIGWAAMILFEIPYLIAWRNKKRVI